MWGISPAIPPRIARLICIVAIVAESSTAQSVPSKAASIYGTCGARCSDGWYQTRACVLPQGPLEESLVGSCNLGPWLPGLLHCTKGSPCEPVRALSCEESFKRFVLTTQVDAFGKATVAVVPLARAELAKCFEVTPDALVFRIVRVQGEPRSALRVDDPELLSPDQDRVAPEAPYAIYVGRSDRQAVVYASTVVLASGETDLQALTSRVSPRWLLATWRTGQLQLLIDREVVSAEAVAELRLASLTGHAWLQSADGKRWPVIAADDSDALRLSDDLYEHLRKTRWHAASRELVPTHAEWLELLRGIQLCVTRKYSTDADGACRSIADVSDVASIGTVTLTLQRIVRDVGTQHVLATTEKNITTSPAIVSTTDTFSVHMTDAAENLVSWCAAARCFISPRELRGLVELRITDGRSNQGATLLRLWVLDPAVDWHPLGRGRSWEQAEEDPDGYAFRRQSQDLTTEVNTPAAVVEAWNASGQRLSSTLAPMPPDEAESMTTAISFDGVCPVGRKRRVLISSARIVDQRVYLHLITKGNDGNNECVARATFTTWEARSSVSSSGDRFVYFGDSQLTVDPAEPAVRFMAPIIGALSRSVANARLELSCGLVVTRPIGAALTAGGAVWSGVQFGTDAAPRLFTAGIAGALLLSGETEVSTYVGLNIGVVYDLIGGR